MYVSCATCHVRLVLVRHKVFALFGILSMKLTLLYDIIQESTATKYSSKLTSITVVVERLSREASTPVLSKYTRTALLEVDNVNN